MSMKSTALACALLAAAAVNIQSSANAASIEEDIIAGRVVRSTREIDQDTRNREIFWQHKLGQMSSITAFYKSRCGTADARAKDLAAPGGYRPSERDIEAAQREVAACRKDWQTIHQQHLAAITEHEDALRRSSEEMASAVARENAQTQADFEQEEDAKRNAQVRAAKAADAQAAGAASEKARQEAEATRLAAELPARLAREDAAKKLVPACDNAEVLERVMQNFSQDGKAAATGITPLKITRAAERKVESNDPQARPRLGDRWCEAEVLASNGRYVSINYTVFVREGYLFVDSVSLNGYVR